MDASFCLHHVRQCLPALPVSDACREFADPGDRRGVPRSAALPFRLSQIDPPLADRRACRGHRHDLSRRLPPFAAATASRRGYTFHTRALIGASSERSPAPTVHTVLRGRSAQRASTPVCRILAAISSQSIDAGWSVLFIATTTHERVFPRLFHLVYTNGPSALSAMSTVNSPRRRALCRRLRRARPA